MKGSDGPVLSRTGHTPFCLDYMKHGRDTILPVEQTQTTLPSKVQYTRMVLKKKIKVFFEISVMETYEILWVLHVRPPILRRRKTWPSNPSWSKPRDCGPSFRSHTVKDTLINENDNRELVVYFYRNNDSYPKTGVDPSLMEPNRRRMTPSVPIFFWLVALLFVFL